MIIYFYLFILLLFLSADSSSIRNRSFKNELVPFLSSRSDPLKKDSNSLKIVSNEPFIIQLQMPNSVEREIKRSDEKEKKRKRPDKKRISKTKALRKKHRRRRDLLTSKAKVQQERSDIKETPNAANATEHQLKNFTKNSINRMEILKALSSYSKIIENRRNKLEGIKNAEKNNTDKRPNLQKRNWLFSERTPYVSMVYPSTPKFDESQHKYTYKDLIADRERLEQKIKYIKNMLNVNSTAPDDSVRVRRRSDSDRTANKIAKMFLTLSAVNGLHDRRKPKCGKDDEDEVWDKERRNGPSKKSVSSNEERYKVKKWIESIKNKRYSSKTCPCMAKENGEEADIFPLEQKLSKDYYHKERERSSEESSESEDDPYYYSRDKLDNNSKKMFIKSQDQENKLKPLTMNAKKKLGLPLNDLELYRSRAKQILQNAEEILDRIKEEEEKRLSTPSVFVNQLRELTSRIQGDPRNNENDLIQKIQKNLGWGPLAKTIEGTNDNNFMDNVKSFILDPYEKAKALTDESTKRLSSYLLRNLGKLEKSSEEEGETRESDDKTPKEEIQVFFERIPQKEEKPVSASLAKEPAADVLSNNKKDLQKWEDTAQLPTVLEDDKDNDKKGNSGGDREEPFKQKVEDIIKEQQKKLEEYKVMNDSGENSREIDNFDESNVGEAERPIEDQQLEKEVVKKTKHEKNQGHVPVQLENNESEVAKKQAPELSESTIIDESERTSSAAKEIGVNTETENSDFMKKKKKPETTETSAEKADETNITLPENMQEKKEFEAEIEEILKNNEKDLNLRLGVQETNNSQETEKNPTLLNEGNMTVKNENMTVEHLKESNLNQEILTKQAQSSEKESEKPAASSNIQETTIEEKTEALQNTNRKEREENVLLSPHYFVDDENAEKFPENSKAAFEGSSNEENLNTETSPETQEKYEAKTNEEDFTKLDRDENNSSQINEELLETSQNAKEASALKDSPGHDQDELLEDNLSNYEVIQMGNDAEKPIEQADVVQKTNRGFAGLSEESYLINDSTLKNNQESNNESLILKDIKDKEDDISKEKPDNLSRTGLAIKDEEEKLHETLNEKESTTPFDEQNLEILNEDNEEKHSDEIVEETLNLEIGGNSDLANQGDNDIKAENSENRQNESLESSQIGSENVIGSQISKMTEETRNESLNKSQIGKGYMKTVTDEENLQDEENEVSEQGHGTPLKLVQSSQINENNSGKKEESMEEEVEKTPNSNEESNSETLSKTRLNKNKDSDEQNYEETNSNQNKNEKNDDDRENSVEDVSDKIFFKAEQDEETYIEKDRENILKSTKVDNDGNDQEENKKNENLSGEDSSETSLMISNKKDSESLNEGSNETSGEDLKNVEESLKKGDKVTSTNANPQSDNLDENQSQEVPLRNNEEQNTEKSEETNLEELKLSQSQENLKEVDIILKSSSEKQNKESPDEVDITESSLMTKNPDADMRSQEVEPKSNDSNSEETLAVNKETEKKLEKAPQGEILKEVNLNEKSDHSEVSPEETNSGALLGKRDPNKAEEMDDEKITSQASSKESEYEKDLVNEDSNESSLGVVLGNEERPIDINNDESDLISNKNKSNEFEEKLEAQGDNEIDHQNSNYGNALEKGRENSLKFGSKDQELETLKKIENDETLQENPEEDEEKEVLNKVGGDETPSRADFDDASDTKAQKFLETPLTSSKTSEVEPDKELESSNVSGETYQEEEDLNNQLDEQNEKILLKSSHVDEVEKEFFEDSHEAERKKNSSGENVNAEAEEPEFEQANLPINPQKDHIRSSLTDLLQKSDSPTINKLKVPKSIGKIMEDLEGQEKDDITAIQNLNPDKIDHIIYKIDEAEQQNLMQTQEIDCRKECACADDIDNKSRNIGRYEIVKDFLHWMKDLQLNRVLSDD